MRKRRQWFRVVAVGIYGVNWWGNGVGFWWQDGGGINVRWW